jgi:hypothetical protein
MIKLELEEIYTGGGCDHYELHFREYGIIFAINNNDCNIPKDGEDWGFCTYASEDDQNSGNYIDCVGPFDDFKKANLIEFCKGFIAAKRIKKIEGYFELSDIDFNELAHDIANVCEPHVLHDSLYFYLKSMSKDTLEVWLKELDANQSFKLTDYIEE